MRARPHPKANVQPPTASSVICKAVPKDGDHTATNVRPSERPHCADPRHSRLVECEVEREGPRVARVGSHFKSYPNSLANPWRHAPQRRAINVRSLDMLAAEATPEPVALAAEVDRANGDGRAAQQWPTPWHHVHELHRPRIEDKREVGACVHQRAGVARRCEG